ncbi:MAG: hypothetical protein ACTSXZ_08010 [Alphaproteobacteria bacterium]
MKFHKGVWFQWVAANAVGALAGGLAVTLLGFVVVDEYAIYAGIVILPALLATNQWLFLRNFFGAGATWIPTNIVLCASLLVPLVGLAWLAVDNAKDGITASQLLALGVICAIVGIGLGGAQRMILYQWHAAKLRWVSATAVGAAPGLTAALYVAAILPESTGIGAPLMLNVLWVFLWIVIAIPQGLVLDRLSRRGALADRAVADA